MYVEPIEILTKTRTTGETMRADNALKRINHSDQSIRYIVITAE